MHKKKKWGRRAIYLLCSAVAVVLLLWISVPLWLPWILRPVANAQGLYFQKYERIGYNRLALHGLSFSNQNVRLKAKKVEAPTPNVWLWNVWTNPDRGAYAKVDDWRLEIVPSGRPRPPGKENSVFNTTHEVLKISTSLQKWLPEAGLSNGTVQVSGQVLTLPSVKWSKGQLDARLGLQEHQANLSANLSRGPPILLNLSSDPLKSEIRLSTNTTGLALQGFGLWQSNRVDVQAHFGQAGLLPMTASLQATNLQISITNLPHYQDIQGSAIASWNEGQFTISATADASPIPTRTNLPPIELSLRARGNTNSARIETALITAPGLKAELSQEVEVHFRGRMLRESAAMTLELDLQRIGPTLLSAGGPFQGILRGKVNLQPSDSKYPFAQFSLTGSQIGNRDLQASTLEATGRLDWPQLTNLHVNAGFDDGSKAIVTGGFDIQQKLLQATHLEFSGNLAKRFLPAEYDYDNLTLVANANGPLEQAAHVGQVHIAGFSSPDLKPITLKAHWTGNLLNIQKSAIQLTAGHSELDLQGSVDVQAAGPRICIHSMTLRSNNIPQLTLTQQACAWLVRSNSSRAFSAGTDPLRWSGPAGDLSLAAGVAWPTSGNIVLYAKGIRSDLFQAFLKTPLPLVQVDTLTFSAHWTNGPVRAALSLSASLLTNFPSVVKIEAVSDETGVNLRQLNVREGSMPLATAQGFLPFVVHPSSLTNRLEMKGDAPLRLQAVVDPKGSFFERVAGWTGLLVEDPHLTANLTGTWNAPKGEIRFGAKGVERDKPGTLPSITELEFRMNVDRQVAHITDGRFLVQGQPATLTARLPLGESFWAGLKKKQLPHWNQLQSRLIVENVDIAAVAELLPEIVAPQGKLALDLALAPGGKLEGFLQVDKAATRPLPTVGPIRDINMRLVFEGESALLEKTTADLGGALVSLAGGADLRGTNWFAESVPPFKVAILGSQVPLSRKAEAIIRSDLNITITKTNGAPPFVSGAAQLRDSYFLSDLGDLVGGGVAGPRRRPPYFSIDKPFLSDWRLSVQVTGERFLKVRSPLFTGTTSANLKLLGTLKDPIALGDIRIDSGHVRFPFGTLAVQRGSVTITSENPYQPGLLVIAQSRQFGYDIRMEVTGSATAPVIQFSSTPPLGSEQILLLLTAGEIPTGQYTMSPEQRAQALAMFLGRELLQKLGIGGLGEERLIIRSGEEITESGKPTYRIQFKLSDDWSLVAEYDRFGDFNAGAQWRFYSK